MLRALSCAQLMEDEVQGDQEGGLHREDGDAGGDGVAPRHARAALLAFGICGGSKKRR